MRHPPAGRRQGAGRGLRPVAHQHTEQGDADQDQNAVAEKNDAPAVGLLDLRVQYDEGRAEDGPVTASPVARPQSRRNHREMITGQVTAWLTPDLPGK